MHAEHQVRGEDTQQMYIVNTGQWVCWTDHGGVECGRVKEESNDLALGLQEDRRKRW